MIGTHDAMQERVLAEAAIRGLSARRIQTIRPNRVKLLSKLDVYINGHPCHLHHLRAVRRMGGRCYSMLGVKRSLLALSAFTFVLCTWREGGERLYIIPSKVLRDAMKGSEFKRFYIPQQPTARWRVVFLGNIDWPLYENAWHLLSKAPVQNASASG